MPRQLHRFSTAAIAAVGAFNTMFKRYGCVANVQQEESGPAFTDRTAEAQVVAGTPFNLLTATTSRFYVGSDDIFERFFVDLAVAGAGLTLVVEYWNGSAWTAVSGLVDGTSNLSADGNVSWTKPTKAEWAKNSVNGGTSWYHIRVTTSTAPSTTPTANYLVINWVTYDDAAGTNVKVFYSPGEDGTRGLYLWVSDNTTTFTNLRVYETWDNVAHTGTAPTPTVAQTSVMGIFKTNVSQVDGVIYVDRDTLIVFLSNTTGAPNQGNVIYVGLFESYVTADAFNVVVWLSNSSASASNSPSLGWATIAYVTSFLIFVQRQYTGTGGSTQCSAPGPVAVVDASGSTFAYPNGPNSKLTYIKRVIQEHGATRAVRGELRHVVVGQIGPSAVAFGDTITIDGVRYFCVPIWSNITAGSSCAGAQVLIEMPNG